MFWEIANIYQLHTMYYTYMLLDTEETKLG